MNRNKKGQFVKNMIPWNKGLDCKQYNWGRKKELSDSYCVDCNKLLSEHGCTRCKECYYVWRKDPKNHPNWNGGKVKTQCKWCDKVIYKMACIIRKNTNVFCSRKCLALWRIAYKSGQNSPNWVNGAKGYPVEFNYKLREYIRQRDNYKCNICGKSQKENGQRLDVHHIDYDKKNCKEDNLISLCHICHIKTNTKRDFWIAKFTGGK